MEQIEIAYKQINELISSINQFIEEEAELATYKAPIIDWHHPDSYSQSSIIGLNKFQSSVETEKGYINSLLNINDKVSSSSSTSSSRRTPKEISSNIPHLSAVWEQVKYSQWPIICISQILECGNQSQQDIQVKVDLVEQGGECWVKVNTIKESRLMAEFREQDSYINSDYESDDSTLDPSSTQAQAGPSRLQRPTLTNSIIVQVTSLVKAAESYPRIPGFPPPRIKYVLNRLEENPKGGYDDSRIQETFQIIRGMGVELILASDQRILPKRNQRKSPKPTQKILLDLSVVVALCCDSTHLPLPASNEELESRFRSLQSSSKGNGELELAPHIPVTKDLRDQLEWEMNHPLIQELKDRLTPLYESSNEQVEFWVTEEVKSRLPAIVDIIGGEEEKQRARMMFDVHDSGEKEGGFWQNSRWKDNAGILEHLKINVLPPEDNGIINGTKDIKTDSSFRKGFMSICKSMLDIVDLQTQQKSQDSSPNPSPNQDQGQDYSPAPTIQQQLPERPGNPKSRKTKKSKLPPRGFTLASKLPSAHTLRTFLVGCEKGWTVLTNNRGAVGKVIREMRVGEGLGYGEENNDGTVDIWVVNPSSLSEWRRKEVEISNKRLLERLHNDRKQEISHCAEGMERLSLEKVAQGV
ncbi:uncharacterized protein IL334_007681 [Kwoniella shivajii]|uniref:DUF1308 domain-containing protein n=1 Tax=Kwoniella shivajii TaxID=564305 RepID=A0ABZ1D9U4_9TREE|nr:hypothetical protein IL334_007681 [Kwoniella shivajii]